MFTRTAFCEDCFKKGRPHKNDLFGVYGHSNDKFWVFQLDHNVHSKDLGFTPHIMTVEGSETDGTVHLDICCGFHKCGIFFYKNTAGVYEISFIKSRKIDIPEKDFKILYSYKDFGYKLI
jgi:hypothetical protein